MEPIFGSEVATSRFAMGSNEPLGIHVNIDTIDMDAVTPGFRRQTECEPCTCQDQQFTYTTVT
jgi:hypothetical protein